MIVGAYVRVSTQEQASEGYSIGEQQERLQKYCDAHDWKIYKIYSDPGYSGANMERPGLKQMLLDIDAGKIKKVVVYKLDRLSRSQKDTLCLIEDRFLAHDVDFVSMRENFDTSTPFGRAMIGVLAVFAQLEREQIKERMQMGRDARAKEGKWMGGKANPLGYEYKNGDLIINDFEALAVRDIFSDFVSGKSCYRIADDMNKKGFKPRISDTFNAWTIRRILESRTYIGFIRYKGRWYQGNHDPIIDLDIFEKAQELLKKRSDARLKENKNPGKVTSYLGGLLICAQCGAHYGKNTVSYKDSSGTSHKKLFYGCRSKYNHGKIHLLPKDRCKNKTWVLDELDALVFEQIELLAVDPEYISESTPEDDDNREELLESEIEKLQAQILKLMDLYQIDGIPLDSLGKKIREIDDRKSKLEKELDGIRDNKIVKITKNEGIEIARSFSDALGNGNFEDIRKVITSLIEYIEIDGDDIGIHWAF